MPTFKRCAVCRGFTECSDGLVGDPVCAACTTQARVDALRPWDAEIAKIRADLARVTTEREAARSSECDALTQLDAQTFAATQAVRRAEKAEVDLARVTGELEEAQRERSHAGRAVWDMQRGSKERATEYERRARSDAELIASMDGTIVRIASERDAAIARAEAAETKLATTEGLLRDVTEERERFAAQREEWRARSIANEERAEAAERERDHWRAVAESRPAITAEANYAFIVERYRELGARAAAAESERDAAIARAEAAERERDEAHVRVAKAEEVLSRARHYDGFVRAHAAKAEVKP